MKKLGIVTISYGYNYGNKLQNYAMQEVYKKCGYSVETIHFCPTLSKKKEMIRKFKRLHFSVILNKLFKVLHRKEIRYIEQGRIANFSKFDQLIQFTKDTYSSSNYSSLSESYDIYSVGSDQVWNPLFSDFSEYYLLNFVHGKKKIAYAPSFGISKIPKEYWSLFSDSLNQFDWLSSREESGASIIQKLIGRKVPVVLDPTLLLNQNDWNQVANFPIEYHSKKYIVLYFLGGMNSSVRKEIFSYAERNHCEIVDLFDVFQKTYSYGPSEFLGLIANAFAIFTDSFHACVFSCIYHKPFMVFQREKQVSGNMNSRIEQLLSTFQLSNRMYCGSFEELFDIDYSSFDIILEQEKKKSLEYIQNALK